MESRTMTVREVQAAVRGMPPRATETDEDVFLGYGPIGLFRFPRPPVSGITVAWPEGDCTIERPPVNLTGDVWLKLEAKRAEMLACEALDEPMAVIWMDE